MNPSLYLLLCTDYHTVLVMGEPIPPWNHLKYLKNAKCLIKNRTASPEEGSKLNFIKIKIKIYISKFKAQTFLFPIILLNKIHVKKNSQQHPSTKLFSLVNSSSFSDKAQSLTVSTISISLFLVYKLSSDSLEMYDKPYLSFRLIRVRYWKLTIIIEKS